MRLRVISYNIHRAIGVDRRFRPDRVVSIISHYEPDLVLLQEVDEGVPRSREVDLARELAGWLGYPHYAVGHNVTLRKGRYGNATLSRYPVLRERNIDLTIPGHKRRGCQHTTLRLSGDGEPGRELELFNLHLGLSAGERVKQVGILVRTGEFASLDPGTPCLVGGDFNEWRSRLYPIFTEILGFRCATQPVLGHEAAIRTYPSFSPRGALDKIYYRGPVRLVSARSGRLALARVASDHLPVVAEFELR